ncbi:restriction endonuclease [Neobacillus pocheonensis]|uniref:Restriction endonuclease n=1 Tax=Neobacillus pocheonensis TaxID=363869 RepID=A0ABT0W5P7_9BACI|nr:restriction endonuclease [Neobacillus pocheonensis]
MIMGKNPSNWRELEDWVGQIFKDLNFEVKIGEDFVRNSLNGSIVNIDVWAKDNSHPTPLIYLIECKHWGKSVSQTVVDGFRSVMNDLGANVGYIISKKGFQEGAYEVAEGRNIFLLTYEEFENTFENKWVESMCQKVINIEEEISDYIKSDNLIEDSGNDYREVVKIKSEIYSLIGFFKFYKKRIKYNKYPFRIIETESVESKAFNNRKDYFDNLIPHLISLKKKFESKIGKQL